LKLGFKAFLVVAFSSEHYQFSQSKEKNKR